MAVIRKGPGLHFRVNLQYNDTLLLLSVIVIVINNVSYYHKEDPNRDWT